MLESPGKKFAIGPFLNLGMQLAIAVGIGFALGYFADLKLHTSPLFLVVGVLLGATSGMLTIYRTVYPPRNKKK